MRMRMRMRMRRKMRIRLRLLLLSLTFFQQTLKELGIPDDMTISFNAGNDSYTKKEKGKVKRVA